MYHICDEKYGVCGEFLLSWLCEGKLTRMRRLCLKTSKAAGQGGLGITSLDGGLRPYALTLPLLVFKFTWYETKSRDMNEKGKNFIFYNKPYTPSGGLHGPLHMVFALCPCSLLLP